jgi:formiminotetrahydrofolate cyclodeaminase
MPSPETETRHAHELAELVSSADAVPGSGWVAGVAAAFAAALVAKAAARSEGWSDAAGVRAQALVLRDRLLALAGQDASAYETALEALERRDAGLERALVRAAEVPLALAESSADVAVVAAAAAECADGVARADAAAAAALAAGAARAAVRLVEVNLTTGSDHERLVRARRAADAATDASRRASAAGA